MKNDEKNMNYPVALIVDESSEISLIFFLIMIFTFVSFLFLFFFSPLVFFLNIHHSLADEN